MESVVIRVEFPLPQAVSYELNAWVEILTIGCCMGKRLFLRTRDHAATISTLLIECFSNLTS